jgi:hypothetical protein
MRGRARSPMDPIRNRGWGGANREEIPSQESHRFTFVLAEEPSAQEGLIVQGQEGLIVQGKACHTPI